MDASLEQEVRRRALGQCEYCQMPQEHYRAPFQIDHIIARQHGGQSEPENLAFACIHCNRYKGPNVAGVDPETREIVRLFNPRIDRWEEHFAWQGPILSGLTPHGRVTIIVLSINRPDYVAVRQALIEEGVFPLTAG